MTPGKDLPRPLRALLAHRYLPLWAAMFAIVLTLPSLRVGLLLDDHLHRAMLPGGPRYEGLAPVLMNLFCFLDGDPHRTLQIMDHGVLPWWTVPEIKVMFWRPVSALTHWLDYRLWPQYPLLMHAQSLLWLGALVAAVTLLYRRVIGGLWVAGLAALLYAIDDVHAVPVAWLANRNALVAAFFGVCALLAHDRWRREQWRAGAIVGPVLLALSLLSGEAGIGTCAYLIAYAQFLERGPWSRRAAALLPFVAVVVLWRVSWTCLGYGTAHMGLYMDPLAEPARFLAAVVERGPILLVGQLSTPPPDFSVLLAPKGLHILWLVSVAFVAVLAVVLVPVLRRNRLSRFWCAGMALAVIPACATTPADRLLLFIGIGAMPLLASLLAAALAVRACKPGKWAWRVPLLTVGGAAGLIHIVLAPLILMARAAFPMGTPSMLESLYVHTALDGSITDQTLVIVNPPSTVHANGLPVFREMSGQPVPRFTRALAPGLPAVVVRRPDEHTLTIRPELGYMAFRFDQMFRDQRDPMRVGQRVALTGMTAEVTALTPDCRPAEVAFHFAVPLEDPSLRWLQWDHGEFVPFTPLPVGTTLELRPQPPAGRGRVW
jgi:hypothetical protein